MSGPDRRFQAKLARSSFGTRQATAARASVSSADASRVLRRADQISQQKTHRTPPQNGPKPTYR